ncbi:MAG: hypothetical protein Ct9H300mP31_10830 [Acidimicrobiaceae bacterium]|nr:MAG: hypothetical protein Ct9H300mP31_10830 [Acidimicrobiaceae bacterium]
MATEAFDTGSTTAGTVSVGTDRDVNVVAIPVRRSGRTVGVVVRERFRPESRPTSEQERTYLTVFDRFASMIEAGEFPYRDVERLRHRTPRVGDGLLLVDAEGRIEFASPNAVSVLHRLGMTRGVVGARFDDTGLGSAMLRSAFSRRTAAIDEMERSDEVAVVSHCFPLLDTGVATGAIVLVRDVTELRRRDRQLVSKDTTIREIHHRVKNNLQTISSLLRLQARRLQSDEARAALGESVRRIGSISVVHETLAQSADDDVAFGEIVRPLVRVVEESVSSPLRPLSFTVQDEAGVVPGQVAMTLAVVLTELLQNACGPCLPTRRGGHLGLGNRTDRVRPACRRPGRAGGRRRGGGSRGLRRGRGHGPRADHRADIRGGRAGGAHPTRSGGQRLRDGCRSVGAWLPAGRPRGRRP